MIALPPEDGELSPFTGWSRAHWTRVADTILEGARRHASPAQSLIRYPGAPGTFGAEVDALEGFARTFMLAAFRIAGDPEGTGPLAEQYARGFTAGVDPTHAERWTRPDEAEQAKVEAAALAVGLHLTRDTVWAQLSERTRQQTVEYLATFVGASHPPNNWAWFRIIVEQFLQSVGGPFSSADREEDFALLDSLDRERGWVADGAGRNFDHYSGWALSFYPILWAGMVAGDPRHAARVARYAARLDDYLDDALHLIGADGAPLLQGRSLTYRFATAAPAWAAAVHGGSRHRPGLLRRAASGQVKHFVTHGAPDSDGLLSPGWHHPWRPIAQDYSGQGSPYWAAKGMLGLALPADHPVWTAEEQPLPIDRGPFARAIAPPGWLAVGTGDGVVRLTNHGTDHRQEGDRQPDAPLYAKLGYSTASAPVLSGPDVEDPIDGTVALVRQGRPSHRSGFVVGVARSLDEQTLIGASSAPALWPAERVPTFDIGLGAAAEQTTVGPVVDIVSVIRGAWEVRFVRASDQDPLHDLDALRVGGWALTSPDVRVHGDADARSARLASRVVLLHGAQPTACGVRSAQDVTPLAGRTAVPWVETAPLTGAWIAFGVLLGAPALADEPPSVQAEAESMVVTWPDGDATRVHPDQVAAGAGHSEPA